MRCRTFLWLLLAVVVHLRMPRRPARARIPAVLLRCRGLSSDDPCMPHLTMACAVSPNLHSRTLPCSILSSPPPLPSPLPTLPDPVSPGLVLPGHLCEGGGECGTTDAANNCIYQVGLLHSRHTMPVWSPCNYCDISVRLQCLITSFRCAIHSLIANAYYFIRTHYRAPRAVLFYTVH